MLPPTTDPPHLPPWLYRYHWHRPHMSLAASRPISRLRLAEAA